VSPPPDANDLKIAAAHRALEVILDGALLGLGSGSTAERFATVLAGRVKAGLRVVCVPTSRRSEKLAKRLGLPLASIADHPRLELTIDGADEIERQSFNLIKGRGGALLREKLVAVASSRLIIIADGSKPLSTLGERQPVPVEVVQFGWQRTAAALEGLGCQATLRLENGSPFITDEGHFIVDCRFPPIEEPAALARNIKEIVGVVEHGLFIGLASVLVIAGQRGTKVITGRADATEAPRTA